MSIAAMAWAKRQKAGSPAAKLVLMVLADYADEHGVCWPARSTIAAEAELSVRSVGDQLNALETAGLVERDSRSRDDGSRTSSTIRLCLGRPADPGNALPGVGNHVPTLGNDVPGGENDLPGGREARSPHELPLEPIDLGTTVPVASASPDAPEKPIPEVRPSKEDLEFEALWSAATPEMRRRAKSKAKVRPEWARARRTAPAEAILGGMLGYVERDPDVKRTGGPGLHIWLKDRTWESWSGAADTAGSQAWSDDKWAAALDIWRETGRWGDTLGPAPSDPGCRVPGHLLATSQQAAA